MSVIKDVLEKANHTEDVAAEVKETLHLLYNYAQEKANNYEQKIDAALRTAGTIENRTVPVTSKLASHQEIRSTTIQTPDGDITDGIKKALKQVLKLSKNGLIDGLAALIDTGLRVVLGAGEGEEREQHTYYIATDGIAIVRLDLMYWCRHVTARSITQYAEKSIVCTAVKSSVDISKIDLNTFLATYNAQLSESPMSDSQVKKEIKNAKEVYEMLRGDAKTQAVTLPFSVQECGVIESVQNKVEGIWPA